MMLYILGSKCLDFSLVVRGIRVQKGGVIGSDGADFQGT